ncbi:MAG: IS1595 family transposase [Jatrophihabitantaceae bacterium]
MKQEFSIPSLAARIATEADAYKLLEQLRWTDGTPDVCPHCAAVGKFYFLAPKDGTDTRKTRTGADTARRLWKCASCRKKFSVLTGTVFHGSKIPVRTWLFVVLEMSASKNGVSAREIERKYNLTAKTAWFMLHRLREAMTRDSVTDLLSGTIVADETWIGGNPKNMHARKRLAMGPDRWTTQKTTVLSVIDKASGEARSAVVPNVTAATLRKAMEQELAVNLGMTTPHTDSWKAYVTMEPALAGHQSVNHHAGEYVRGDVSTNMAEGFFSQLKRSIDGTHHHVSVEHLPRYLAQFDWLYTHCHATDSQRLRLLVGNVGGRRLTYRPLIAAGRSATPSR